MGFDPSEARDEAGRWSTGGAGSRAGKAAGAKLAQRAKDVARTGTVAGSTAGGYSPGTWSRSDSVPDRQAKVDKFAQRLAADLKTEHPDWAPQSWETQARALAEDLVPHDVTTYTNGPHKVQMIDAVPEPRRAQFLGAVDRMIQTYAGPTVNLSVEDKNFAAFVGGETQLGTGNIRINAKIFGGPGSPWEGGAHWGGGMPASAGVGIPEYVLAHEWGHAANAEPFAYPTEAAVIERRVSGMSDYGKGSEFESYAEAFAEWSLTGGKTTNVAAQQYAHDYGWAKRWPNAKAA